MYNVLLFAVLCITYTPSGMTDLTGGIKRKKPSLLREETRNDRRCMVKNEYGKFVNMRRIHVVFQPNSLVFFNVMIGVNVGLDRKKILRM